MIQHSREVGRASALRREILMKLHKVGIRNTLKLGAYKLIFKLRKLASSNKEALHHFDLRYGTDTSGIINQGAMNSLQFICATEKTIALKIKITSV